MMDFRANDGKLDPAEVEVRQMAGRDYLVAPTVLVKEGDLNGGYMPAAELEASAPGWNGVPVTVDHPTDEDGEFVPANQPEFIEQMGIGHVYNVEYDDDIRGLRGEMWVDINRARDLDGDARTAAERLAYHTESVESNADVGLLEVSTGYFHNVEQTSNGATQTDLLPDHLAALPNDTGACSVEDGCGAPRVTANESDEDTPDESFVSRLANAIAGAFAAPDAPNPDTVTANTDDTPTPETDMSNFDFERLSTASGIDVATLREMDEQSLAVIERGATADEDEDEPADDETDPDEEPADDDTPGEETDPLEALAANCSSGTGSMDALVDRITEQVASNVTEQVQNDLEAQSERQQQVAFIAANSSYDIDSLAEYDANEIARLAEFVEQEADTTRSPSGNHGSQRVGANYVGRGAPSRDDDEEDEDRATVLSTYNQVLDSEDD